MLTKCIYVCVDSPAFSPRNEQQTSWNPSSVHWTNKTNLVFTSWRKILNWWILGFEIGPTATSAVKLYQLNFDAVRSIAR